MKHRHDWGELAGNFPAPTLTSPCSALLMLPDSTGNHCTIRKSVPACYTNNCTFDAHASVAGQAHQTRIPLYVQMANMALQAKRYLEAYALQQSENLPVASSTSSVCQGHQQLHNNMPSSVANPSTQATYATHMNTPSTLSSPARSPVSGAHSSSSQVLDSVHFQCSP